MSSLYIMHYYVQGTDTWKSIMLLSEVAMFQKDVELASEHKGMDALLRSIGMEPDALPIREKWPLITRIVPLVDNNYNLCNLGPCSTGKSHLFMEISPNRILVSGGTDDCRQPVGSLAVLGEISISGTMIKADELANT